MSLNYKVIGKHIREVRQRNHLSQAMLSELVDKTPSYISYIESGIKSMSLDTYEMMILLDVIKSLKASLKEHQGRYGKPDNFDFTV